MIDWTFAKSISDAANWKHDRANIIRIGASRTAVSGGREKRVLALVFFAQRELIWDFAR
jgi:hypothetical protein